MIEAALVGAGGVNYLIRCAHKQPVAFLSLVGRVLPLQIAGKGENGAIPISFEWAPAIIEGVAVAKDAVENKQLSIDATEQLEIEPLEDAAD